MDGLNIIIDSFLKVSIIRSFTLFCARTCTCAQTHASAPFFFVILSFQVLFFDSRLTTQMLRMEYFYYYLLEIQLIHYFLCFRRNYLTIFCNLEFFTIIISLNYLNLIVLIMGIIEDFWNLKRSIQITFSNIRWNNLTHLQPKDLFKNSNFLTKKKKGSIYQSINLELISLTYIIIIINYYY